MVCPVCMKLSGNAVVGKAGNIVKFGDKVGMSKVDMRIGEKELLSIVE